MLSNKMVIKKEWKAAKTALDKAVALGVKGPGIDEMKQQIEVGMEGIRLKNKEISLKKAERLLKRTMARPKSDHGYAHAHARLGKMLRQQNNLEEAKKHLEKAIEMNPKSAFAQAELDIVLKLQQSNEGLI